MLQSKHSELVRNLDAIVVGIKNKNQKSGCYSLYHFTVWLKLKTFSDAFIEWLFEVAEGQRWCFFLS